MKKYLSLILLLIISCSGTVTFEKQGVIVEFPGRYKKDSNIGNQSVGGIEGARVESYTYESKKGIFGINFLTSSTKFKGTLEDGMHGAVKQVNGELIDYNYKIINKDTSLKYQYKTYQYVSQGGPVIFFVEQSYILNDYKMVVLKFVGKESAINSKIVDDFFKSFRIK